MNLRITSVTLGLVLLFGRAAFSQSADASTSSIATPAMTESATPSGTPIDPLKIAQYRLLLDQANEAIALQKYDDASKLVEQAEKLLDPNAVTLNLRGAIMAKQKKFDAAISLYQQAIKLQPDFFPAVYNLGEIDFERGEYGKAAEYFQKMLTSYPGNELLQFMIFLSYVKVNNTPEAEKWMNAIRFPSDSPSWYYAQAVWNLKNGNKGEAKDLLRSSAYIFGDKNKFFNETLEQVELLPIK